MYSRYNASKFNSLLEEFELVFKSFELSEQLIKMLIAKIA
jgi:hypothetical protein